MLLLTALLLLEILAAHAFTQMPSDEGDVFSPLFCFFFFVMGLFSCQHVKSEMA